MDSLIYLAAIGVWLAGAIAARKVVTDNVRQGPVAYLVFLVLALIPPLAITVWAVARSAEPSRQPLSSDN